MTAVPPKSGVAARRRRAACAAVAAERAVESRMVISMHAIRMRTAAAADPPPPAPPRRLARGTAARRVTAAVGAFVLALSGASAAHAAGSGGSGVSAGGSSSTHKPAAASAPLTEPQASAQAKKTGKPVDVTAAESATSTLTANPNGGYTLDTFAEPVRKLVGGAWKPLDATLHKNADGTISPALTTTGLALSGGGPTLPLASMSDGSDSLSLTLPATLPVPTLSGDSATYANVIPGVDLVVTVTAQGGFSDVYVVRDAAAADNPELSTLLSARIKATGLTVKTDAAGDVEADNAQGVQVFGAGAPSMWDSATAGASNGAASSNTAATAGAYSSVSAPGAHAHRGSLAAQVSGDTLTLTPDSTLLHTSASDLPVYLAPAWTGGKANWSTPSEDFPASPYWDDSAESAGFMQVGMPVGGGLWADTLVNFDLPLSLLGSEGTSDKITGATFYAISDGSSDCSADTVDIFAPSATLISSKDHWNDWFTSNRSGLGSAVGSASVPGVYKTGCTADQSVGWPLSLTWLRNDVANGKSVQTLAMAGDSYSDEGSEKVYDIFSPTSPELKVTFFHAPAFGTLSTSPDASTIGRGDIYLDAPVSDPDGGPLSVTFDAYVTGSPGEAIKSGTVTANSGTTAELYIPESTLAGDVTAYGGTSGELPVSWSATVTNGNQTVTSATQSFTYDPATVGQPDIWIDSGLSQPCQGSSGYTVGTPATFYFAPSLGQTAPIGYSYQIDEGEPVAVTASGGTASAIVTPAGQTNLLTVSEVNAAGTVGQQAVCVFSAAAAGTETPGDLTGDGNADLLVPGSGSAGLPSGLWLSGGTGGGTLSPDAAQIGSNGNGIGVGQGAAQWTGTQAITGLFQGGGFNGVLDYDPAADGSAACAGSVLDTYGQALPLDPVSGQQADASPPDFTYYDYDDAGDSYTTSCATSVANGGNLYNAEYGATSPVTSGVTATFPDLLMIANGSLFLAPEQGAPGDWSTLGGNNSQLAFSGDYDLSDTNPAGTGSWAGWTITTALVGDLPVMFAISGAGAVYYYSPAAMAQLAFNQIVGGTGAVSPTEVATSGFDSNTYVDVEAVNFGGTLGLWAVAPSGTVTTWLHNTASGTSLSELGTGVSLVTAAHDWPLNDGTTNASGAVTAADLGGSLLTLTGSGGVTWQTDDPYFSPDVQLDGTGALTAGGPAVTIGGSGHSFTVSAWVNPESTTGTVLSQSGTNYPGFTLAESGGHWSFALNTGSGSANTYTSATGGTVDLDEWSKLTADYNASSGVMQLYVDGVLVGNNGLTAPVIGASGDFTVGAAVDNGTATGFFTGEIAGVQSLNSAVPPIAPPSPAAYHYSLTAVRIMDTRSGLGGTTGPVGLGSVTKLKVTGVDGIPSTGVVAVDVDLTGIGSGSVSMYPDGDQAPITSSDAIGSSGPQTAYEIVPVGADGEIDLALSGAGAPSAQYVVDATGYFDTQFVLGGAQEYHPLQTPERVLAGATTSPGALGNGGTTTVQITGQPQIPSDATAVSVDLTATNGSGEGSLEAYATGSAPVIATELSYDTAPIAVLAGDVPVGTGGTITLANEGGDKASVNVSADVEGYYTTETAGTADPTGQVYHAVDPDRLVDTRYGIGGLTGAIGAGGTYALGSATLMGLTTAQDPTLVLNATVTGTTAASSLTAYPSSSGSEPATADLYWTSGLTVANLAMVPTGTADGIDLTNAAGTTQIVIDSCGYFSGS